MNDSNVTTSKTQRISTRNIVFTALFTAVICVIAPISISQPIPFSFSVLAIFLTGALLPPAYAFASALIYLFLGAAGVPVFAGMKGGLQVLGGATGGYLMAYPLMTFVIASAYKHIKKYKVFALALGMTIALLLCYLIGTIWFSFSQGMNFYKALTLCVIPFIPFDILKMVLAISFSSIIRKRIFTNIYE